MWWHMVSSLWFNLESSHVCCLMTPSHYLKQHYLIAKISGGHPDAFPEVMLFQSTIKVIYETMFRLTMIFPKNNMELIRKSWLPVLYEICDTDKLNTKPVQCMPADLASMIFHIANSQNLHLSRKPGPWFTKWSGRIISERPEASRYGLKVLPSLCNLTDASALLMPRSLPDVRQIHKVQHPILAIRYFSSFSSGWTETL